MGFRPPWGFRSFPRAAFLISKTMAKQETKPEGISLPEVEERIKQARKADQDLIAFIEKERDENIANMATKIKNLESKNDELHRILGLRDQEILELRSRLEDKENLISELELELSEIKEKENAE